MSGPLPEEQAVRIQAALRAGNKIEAISLYREFMGVGLAEAKAAMDALEERLLGGSLPSPADTTPSAGASVAINEALFAGKKIEAIRLYRQSKGTGLAEAKTAVEMIEAELRAASPERFAKPSARGCVSTIVFCGVIGFLFWRLS